MLYMIYTGLRVQQLIGLVNNTELGVPSWKAGILFYVVIRKMLGFKKN